LRVDLAFRGGGKKKRGEISLVHIWRLWQVVFEGIAKTAKQRKNEEEHSGQTTKKGYKCYGFMNST